MSVMLISIFSGITFGMVLDCSPVIPGIASFVASFIAIPAGAGCLYGLIFTAPGGIAVPFTTPLPSLPEMLHWNDAAAPLTSLRLVTKEEGTLFDLVAAGIAAINGYMKVGTQAANDVCIMLASGFLNRQVTLSGVTSAAGAINFYASSDNSGDGMEPVPYKYQADTNLALTPTVYQNFTALFIPTMATGTDYADVEYIDGHRERMEIQDIIGRSTDFQQVPGIVINNLDLKIHRVTLRTTAATVVYTMRYYIKGQ